MAVNKPRLSRDLVYVPMKEINFSISDLNLHRLAFMDAGVEPEESDWVDAEVIDSGHSAFDPNIGEALATLVGPTRGDPVTTTDLGIQDWQVWVECSTASSTERPTRVAGVLTISLAGGS